MTGWTISFTEFEPGQQGVREALCTLGNGYLGTRGAFDEACADGVHYPGTYISGCYNRLTTEIGEHAVENEDLVNAPNWLPLGLRVADGDWLDLRKTRLAEFRQELDLRNGLLSRSAKFSDDAGRVTRIESCRFVHMAERHLAGSRLRIIPENWSGPVQILSALDGRVENRGVERYRDLNGKHLLPVESRVIDGDVTYLKMQTRQSDIQIAETARTTLYRDGTTIDAECETIEEPGFAGIRYSVEAHEGQPLTVEKIVSIYTSRDPAISECGLASRMTVERAGSFDELAITHSARWHSLWHWFDIEIDNETAADAESPNLILRLHLFHALQVMPSGSLNTDAGIPARGLHGEAYRGHVFWDELFVFPTLNLRLPETTRSLLMYRYNRLSTARQNARDCGHRGALYPWQSGSDGREESQKLHLNPRSGRWMPDNSALQRHVNAAIAYNIWQYFQTTHDVEFLTFYGAEMFLEIARFWASLAEFDDQAGRYMLRNVMGPDEYHDSYPEADKPGLDNNAYTSAMSAWCLWRAVDLMSLLPEDCAEALSRHLQLEAEELTQWDQISRKIFIPFHDGGIISQFEGYGALEEFDWVGYRAKYGDIQRLDRILEAEGDTPNRFKASKQADVLMLFYLFSSEELGELFGRLGYPFEFATIPDNIEYYASRTCHGSTLSRVVHAWVLSRVDRPRSWELFHQALISDFKDIQGGTTAEGIHLGAMTGTVDIVQRCYTGIEVRNNVLWLNPCLPTHLTALRFNIRYRGHTLSIDVTPNALALGSGRTPAPPIQIGIRDKVHTLRSGEKISSAV